MARAEDLLERARRAAASGHPARAEQWLVAAARAATDPDLAARVEVTRAYVEAETGQGARGLERCRAVLERGDVGPVTRGRAWQQLGLLHMRGGEAQPALTAFARAVELLPEDVEDHGFALLNRGTLHLQRQRPDLAVTDLEDARAALARLGLETPRAMAEHNLGYARLLRGDLVGALRAMDDAGVVLDRVSVVNRAVGSQDRAEALLAVGRPREAVRALETAAAAYGARRLRTYQADCEVALAWTVLREDPARARVVARRAARRFRAQASPVPALRADAAAVVAEVAAGARSTSLLLRADRLVEQLLAAGYRRDAELLHLQATRVALARGDLDDVTRRLRRLRPGPDAPVATRLLEREVRAELAEARGARRRAREHVRSGLAELHGWQASFGSLDLQSTLVGHGRALAVHGLRLALADGSPETVFEWSERARALVTRVAPVRPPADPQVAADLAELRSLPPGSRRTPQGRRAAELRERVRRRSWYGEGGGAVAEPDSLERLRAALAEDDAALVAHVVVDRTATAVVVTGDDAGVVPLGAVGGLRRRLDAVTADLTTAAEHPGGDLGRAVRDALGHRLAELADQLLAPLLPLLGDRRLVLTPSGSLAGTPWPLLPGLVGRPLSLAPSATRWRALRATTHGAPSRVGLVAGPRLVRAEEEVARAAGPWEATGTPARLLRGEGATAAAVSALAAEVDLLHLAGHGTHPGENPLFAAVELADGPWSGYDIDQLPRPPSTVVLSACELGRASVRSGEEAVGMTAAWLHAGARTVVSSPVVLADDLACEALASWHALVARGVPPADALAQVGASAPDLLPLVCAGAGW